MAVVRVSDRFLRGLGPAQAGREFRDSTVPGFSVRVLDSGRVSFSVHYRVGGRNGVRRRMGLGLFPEVKLGEARDRAREVRRLVRHGVDPAERLDEAVESRPTVAELVARFFAAEGGTRWRAEQRRTLEAHVLPALGDVVAEELARGEVAALFDALAVEAARTSAFVAWKSLRQVFEWALDRELVTRNPVRGVRRPAPVDSRTRVLAAEELRRLWRGFDAYPGPMGPLLALELVTLQRGGELLGMCWAEVSADGEWWTIPRERTKAKRADHLVWLGPLARAILAGRPRGGELVFAGEGGGAVGPTAPSRAMRRICARVGVEDARPHDLRRTGATLLSERLALTGRDDFVVGLILGHASATAAPRVTGVYNRYAYAREKREAGRLYDALLREVLTGTGDGQAGGEGAQLVDVPADAPG